jgi:hypothetical protein
MENVNNFSWKTGLFSKTWNIYRNNRQVGSIEKPFFSKKSTAEFNGKRYEFQDAGFVSLESEVIDAVENKAVGKVQFDANLGMGIIQVNDEKNSTVEMKSGWRSKLTLHNSTGLNILYDSSVSGLSGKIETNKDDDLKLLSGLYFFALMSKFSSVTLLGVLAFLGLVAFAILALIF